MSLLIALGLAGALVQSPVAPPIAAVSGRVMEHGSGTPVAGAQVLLIPSSIGSRSRQFPDRPRAAITDPDGGYQFDDVQPGRYRIVVEKAGFARLDLVAMPEVVVERRERHDGVDVTLQRSAAIAGRVVDDMGEAMVGAQVMAMRRPDVPPGSGLRDDLLVPAGHGAQSNDLGEFRLFGLPPGEYYVQAMPTPDLGGVPARHATVLLPTYFPGTSDRTAAQPIRLEAGQTSGDVIVRMTRAPAFEVSGVVRDESGRPVVNAVVKLVLDDTSAHAAFVMGRWDQSRTDASGAFTIHGVTNGTYTLLAIAPLQISPPPPRALTGGGNGSGRAASFTFGSSLEGGMTGGVMTETSSSGATVQYRDDMATRLSIAINQAGVSGLEVVVRTPTP